MSQKTLSRQLTENIHVFCCPFKRFSLFKIGARCTVIRLKGDSLIVISPISLKSDRTPLEYIRNKLGGKVCLIIAPDLAHWLSVEQWKKEFPSAKVIGVEGHDKKTRNKVDWDTLFTKQTDPDTIAKQYKIHDEIKFVYFSGFIGKDLVIYHVPSKTLIEADLLFNLPATEQFYGKTPSGVGGLLNRLNATSVWSQRFLWYVGKKDLQDMQLKAIEIAALKVEMIIPCHGNLIEAHGSEIWSFVFKRFLIS